MANRQQEFLEAGVLMPDPRQVWIGDDVPTSAVAPGVVLHPGCRLEGADLSIGPGCELGVEGPVSQARCVRL